MQNKGARQLSHALGLQPQTGMRTYTLAAAAACKCRPLRPFFMYVSVTTTKKKNNKIKITLHK